RLAARDGVRRSGMGVVRWRLRADEGPGGEPRRREARGAAQGVRGVTRAVADEWRRQGLAHLSTHGRHAQVVATISLRDEAAGLLQDLIRLDTVNPPGNETRVAEHLRSYLESNGVAWELYARGPGRGNLAARIPGRGG